MRYALTMRFMTTAALVSIGAAPALAQDMPLSQILIDGEGWKKVEKPGAKPGAVYCGPRVENSVDQRRPGTEIPCGIGLADGWILFAGDTHIVTFPKDHSYVPPSVVVATLRLRNGAKSIDVTGLATDRDGRIYAATDLGVQVFDPTGRLCGVLTPAAAGQPEVMKFEGDALTMWIGNTKYARKLRTEGAK